MAGTSKDKLGPGCYTRDKDLNLIGTLKSSNSLQSFGTKVDRGLALNTKSHPNLWYLPLRKSPKRITSQCYLTTDPNEPMKFLPIKIKDGSMGKLPPKPTKLLHKKLYQSS